MKSYTATEARQSISEVMDIASSGEPVEITRRDGTSNVLISREEFDAWQNQKLDAEFADIMQHYGKPIEALTNR
ncbi:type II toxin-antitoxin system Phd/YefM family antitoxin [Klebsiella pneumoniae]|jgi:antitoxin Phd|uniref:type II toxin-antitoxin system Phd/YefM family antitoxin n=1 Tax=Klebsiella TaxID=570 RepID=UPI0015DD4803|nr:MULTISPECIES: type II toxin-antitoxin system Phd/YefM family antitoxin [Klebsiella]HAT1642337.1 type II toxin-antitoxin system Phd/YefM family antitoxin [Raoultella ornithinolytica]MBD7346146.1 type II toxin-antitoxin system Phd/YefM family antitoxin [Klebsiella pneumoniae]MBD7356865.1 type II toxin-antitoxin system Phd/YefM family antitoxin [Klebsiella pneumoniae]MBD7367496.1 type II toxin-antitoxin system Phd/YefM family antitoxin [Klebsiella pneumoniae]MBD7373001.1 type II toxin-antitoxi